MGRARWGIELCLQECRPRVTLKSLGRDDQSLNYISLHPIFMQLGADICWMCDNNLASDKYAQKTVPHIFLLQLYKKKLCSSQYSETLRV